MSRTEKKHPDKVCPNGRKHCACGMFWWNVKKRAVEATEMREAGQAVIDRAVERTIGCGVCGEINDPACVRRC